MTKRKKPLPARRVTKADHKRVRAKLKKLAKPKAKKGKAAPKVKKLRPRPFQLNWSTRDQTVASHEGWGLFMSPRGLEVEKADKPHHKPRHAFATDAEAYWYVAFRAARGSGMHMRALDEVREHNFHRYPRELGIETGMPMPHELPPHPDRPDADIYQGRPLKARAKRHKSKT